jgi:hypothetical protein
VTDGTSGVGRVKTRCYNRVNVYVGEWIMKRLFLVACVVLSISVCLASEKEETTFRGAPPEVMDAVKARVVQFYTYFKEAKFRQAEALVTEESKDLFYNAPKKPLLGFEVATIQFNEQFDEAKVLVNVDTMSPLMGATPFKLPVGGKWVWVNDNWFLHMEERKRESPFGEMKGGTGAPQGVTAGAFSGQGIKPEALQNMYAVETRQVRFPGGSDEPVERSVVLHNTGPAKLEIEKQGADLPGLTVDTGEGQVEPGEQREIRFTYDPTVANLTGERDIYFGVLPLMQRFAIKVLVDN